MTEANGASQDSLDADWPARPWLLAAMLGMAGLAIHFASGDMPDVPWRMALSAFLFFGPLAAALTLERARWQAPLAFAVGVGLMMAGLAFHAVRAGDAVADEEFAFAAGILAVLLAVPLFQAGFHRFRFATPYAEAHRAVWTDAISAGGALAFTGLSWLTLFLLASLFQLLRIDLLKDLMEEEWFGWTFSGIAFGAALGQLRNQQNVLGTVHAIVVLVLSLLAVPLALGLTIFLVAMIVSGPDVLWEATRSATPVLLACAAGAFLLVNAVIRASDAEMSQVRIVRLAALVLSLVILPLTVFAAVSMGTRIAQHGLSPERLWGMTAIAAAVACGIAYLVAVLRGRSQWTDQVRDANLHVAVAVCALALLLALPLVDFGAISARNQVARLEAGAVSPEDFDYDALRWDFGDAGRSALRGLARSGNDTIADAAQDALERDSRAAAEFRRRAMFGSEQEVAFDFADAALREWVRGYVRDNPWFCDPSCVALDLGMAGERRHAALVRPGSVTHVYFRADGVPYPPEPSPAPPAPDLPVTPGTVEVRPYEGRQIYVDGQPVGHPFD